MKDKNLILIDANNFFFRAYLAPKLQTNGKPVEVVYSVFKNLISTIENIRNYTNINDDVIAFCYDRGYEKRLQVTKDAVNRRIFPMTYKAKRRIMRRLEKNHMSEQQIQDQIRKKQQIDWFYELCQLTRVNQVFVDGNEADDVICSYTHKYKDEYNVFIVTNDKDYYQLLDYSIIYNSRDNIFITIDKIKEEYGISSSSQWVDMGGIMGDTSDTIYGIQGIGKVGAKNLINHYGNIQCMYAQLKSKGTQELNKQRLKYSNWQDFSKNVKQTIWNKTELKVLFSQQKCKISKFLKQMFNDLEIQPITNRACDRNILYCAFNDLKFQTIMKKIDILVNTNISQNTKKTLLSYFNKKNKIYFCDNCQKQFMGNDLENCPVCEKQLVDKQNIKIVEQPDLF